MSDDRWALVIFIVVIEMALLARVAIKLDKGVSLIDHLKTKEGKGILFGMVAFPVVLFAITLLSGCSGATYMNETEVFMGVDRSRNQSALCKEGGSDDRISSNGGLRQNVVRLGRLDINAGYLHKSCAISPDYRSIDAGFIEGVWTITDDLIPGI